MPEWKRELMRQLNYAAWQAQAEDDPDYEKICTLLGGLDRD